MNEDFEGLVLFKRVHRENDSLVKIFTQPYGTKMFFVRGLEKPNHPLLSNTIPLTSHRYIGTINEEGLSFIREARSVNIYRNIQTDYIKQAYATYIAQLVDAALEDNEPNEQVYQLINIAFRLLEEGMKPEIVATYMEMYLLPIFGTHLNWKRCVICGATTEPFDFSIRRQGLLCRKHFNEDQFRLQINPKAMHVAYILANSKLTNINSVKVSQETLSELRRLMDEIFREFVGIRLKSKSYLDQLTDMEDSIHTMIKKRTKPD